MVIVAAVDRSDRAKTVIKEADELARAFNETVHVVHVLSQSEFVDLEKTHYDKAGAPIEMDEIRDYAKEIAADTIPENDVAHEAVGLVGDVEDRLGTYANEQEARYLVIAGRKRSPTGKAIFGSTAQKVLLNADRPVVATFET